jgi:hypothetical protein
VTGLAFLLTFVVFVLAKAYQAREIDAPMWKVQTVYLARLAYGFFIVMRSLPAKVISHMLKSRRGKKWLSSRYVAAWRIIRKGKPAAPPKPKKMTPNEMWEIIRESVTHTPQRGGDMVYYWNGGSEPEKCLNMKTGKFVKPSNIEVVRRSAQVRPQYQAEPMVPPIKGTTAKKPKVQKPA